MSRPNPAIRADGPRLKRNAFAGYQAHGEAVPQKALADVAVLGHSGREVMISDAAHPVGEQSATGALPSLGQVL